MEKHAMQGVWDQVRGIARELWGEMTGDATAFSAGQREQLIGRLEGKYGLSRAEAERRVEVFCKHEQKS